MDIDARATTLRALREAAGLTQAEAAERIGVTQQTISRAERTGETSLEVLRGLVKLYQASTEAAAALLLT